jgi:hypothetical protein
VFTSLQGAKQVLDERSWRLFRLSDGNDAHGVCCDARGLSAHGIPLLQRGTPDKREAWQRRPIDEVNGALSLRYSLPIDFAAKMAGLEVVAGALNRGEIALAQIAALRLQLPDPFPLAKVVSEEEAVELALQLYWAGILKGDWDPLKHPRIGTPPNPGWFADVPKEPKLPVPSWPSREINRKLRDLVKEMLIPALERDVAYAIPGLDVAWSVLDTFMPTELNQGEARAIAQWNSAWDPPKTLEELQHPNPDTLGYEQHHIVEQNAVNRSRFGDAAIDDPSNIVWVPRLKHEMITGEYNSSVADSGSSRLRDTLDEMDFEQQRQKGLEIMRKYGVLK